MEQILLNHPWTFSFPSGSDAYSYFIATIKGNDCQWSTGRVWFNPCFSLARFRCSASASQGIIVRGGCPLLEAQ